MAYYIINNYDLIFDKSLSHAVEFLVGAGKEGSDEIDQIRSVSIISIFEFSI